MDHSIYERRCRADIAEAMRTPRDCVRSRPLLATAWGGAPPAALIPPRKAEALSRDDPSRPGRVALTISSLSGGGAERILSGLAGELARSGREVSVVTIGSASTDFYALEPEVSRVALDLLHPSRHFLEAIALSGRRAVALRRALTRLRPCAVVSFMRATNVLTLLAMTGTNTPVVVCERTDPRHEPAPAAWSALRRLLYPRAAAVVVQTESVAAWARAFCRNVCVIPNFVARPARTASPGEGLGPKLLVAMGRLGPEKGFDLLIEAFARVADSRTDWSLTILGEGRERERLRALVRAHRLNGRVSLPGHVRDPGAYLAAAHVFALPSRREGFPNALLEAMACGLPVVAFDCPSGPADIITHERDGLLVENGDVARLAAALDRLMGSPAERARLGNCAGEVATRLAPARVLVAWEALLASVGA